MFSPAFSSMCALDCFYSLEHCILGGWAVSSCLWGRFSLVFSLLCSLTSSTHMSSLSISTLPGSKNHCLFLSSSTACAWQVCLQLTP